MGVFFLLFLVYWKVKWSLTGPFFQVVSNAEKSRLDLDLVTTTKHKSLKTFVVFDITKDRFYIVGPFFTVFDPFFAH
jgi:hypothetical protein